MLKYAAIIALLSGCAGAPTTTYHVHIEEGFTPLQDAAIVSGIERWQEATGRALVVVWEPSCEAHDGWICLSAGRGDVHGREAVTTPTRADGSGYSSIQLDVDVWPGDWQAVAHELGHAFGLVHRQDGIMTPYDTPGKTITEADALRWLDR